MTLRLALAAALLAVTLAVFWPVRHHEFVDLDDYTGIVLNPDLAVSSLPEAIVVSATRPINFLWTPLTMLSLIGNHWLHGSAPAPYLLTNVALHALATLLLFHVFTRATGAVWASAFVAAVFAIHPLHVESVAWASERKDVMSGLFFALTLLAYLHYVERPARKRYLLLLACLALGLLAKPMLVTLPGVLLLLDYWPLRRLDAAAVREKLPMLALVGLDAFATLAVQGAGGAMSFGMGLPLWLRIANAIDATCIYVWQTFWPTDLAVFYPHPGASLTASRVLLGALLLALLTGVAFALRRAQPWWITGWLWFLGMLVPVIGLVQVGQQGRADRYTYLPMIGLTLAVAFGARHFARTPARRIATTTLAVCALLACGWLASRQVATWRNSVALYEQAIAVNPDAAYPQLRLGMVYAIQGELGAAQAPLRRAVELDPTQAAVIVHQLESLSSAHADAGRPELAVQTAVFAIRVAEETSQPDAAASIRARLPALRGPR